MLGPHGRPATARVSDSRSPLGVIGRIHNSRRVHFIHERPAFAPQHIICAIHDAIVIVITRYADADHAQHATCVQLRSVPSVCVRQPRQLQRGKCATECAPIENVERIAGPRHEPTD